MARKSENKGKENFEFGFKIFEEILTQRFNVNGTGFTPRDVNELNKKELLWENYTSAKWRKYNFVEYIWLKLIFELTSFGIKKAIIAKIREELMRPITVGKYKALLGLSNSDDIIDQLGLTADEYDEFIGFFNGLPEDEVMSDFTYMLFLIVVVIYNRQNAFILINKEGDVFPYFESNLPEVLKIPEAEKEYSKIAYNDHIMLNLTSKVADFAKHNFEIDLPTKLNILSEEENEVLNLIRSKKLKSLKISFDGEDISLIEATEDCSVNQESRFVDFIIKGGYQSVSFTTVKGKVVKFENTIKIKPQNRS